MPSNNKIIINLKNQGDSWTAPCDGYIWGMKIGGSEVVNSWLNVWDSANADTTNYGTLIYCDYGQPYINLCGNLAVRKGQTVYFNWNNNCRVYFYPALNANSSVYGEDFRIYIKVVDSNGNIIKRAQIVILNDSQMVIYQGITYEDGRHFISKNYINVLKNLPFFIVKANFNNIDSEVSYEWSMIDENKINEITVSLGFILL